MNKFYLTSHFKDRVNERMKGVDPESLAEGLAWAVENARADLVWYARRIKHEDGIIRRVFQFLSLCGKRLFEVVLAEYTDRIRFVTVYEVT